MSVSNGSDFERHTYTDSAGNYALTDLPPGALTLSAPIPAGLHRLEVESLGGGAVTPGAVALAVSAGGAGTA